LPQIKNLKNKVSKRSQKPLKLAVLDDFEVNMIGTKYAWPPHCITV